MYNEADIANARNEIQKIIRSLRSISEPDRRDRLLNTIGISITNEAKKRAPVDRGQLRRAITHRVTSDGVEVGVLGGNAKAVPYARIQEEGGTITIKKRRWLTIPIDPKYRDRSPYDFDLKVVAQLGGALFLVDRATGQFAYRLVKKVKIEAQPYLTPGAQAYIDRKFSKDVDRFMDEIKKGFE